VVEEPAYSSNGPVIAIDEAHANFHTSTGRYRPFAELLRADGYRVKASGEKFHPGTFTGIAVLVVANPQSGNRTEPASTAAECDAVFDWVQSGGALLLIADHAPFGSAAENLAHRFGVTMGKGWVYDHTPGGANAITTQLDFSRENQLLGTHPLLAGRNAREAINKVRAFTGQSLGLPRGATALLKLSPTAREVPTTADLDAAAAAAKGSPAAHPAPGALVDRVQGLAMPCGEGRLVVMGEAAMFSAQVITLGQGDQKRVIRAGMNVSGYDDRQLALNVLHWLSGLIP